MTAARPLAGTGSVGWLGGLQERIREAIVPLDEVAAALADGGRTLEIGCGEGLVLKRLARRPMQLTGVDLDERKVARARSRFQDLPELRLVTADAFAFLAGTADGAYSAALLVDTLSSFSPEDQARLIRELFRCLEPGGLLVIKAIDGEAGWKTACSRALSGLIYRVLRLSLSDGQRFSYLSAAALQALLAAQGAEVAVRHLHRERFHPIPHILLTARKARP